MASVLYNAVEFREFLSNSKSALKVIPGVTSIFRIPLGTVKGTQDTALYYLETYSTKEEFDRIMTESFSALDGSKPWNDFGAKREWGYLFRLQNSNGETLLHRAAAMSNLGVVSYICEHAPDVSRQLDSMNRSALWHAACGGDDKIMSVIAEALKFLRWAPGVDYPDDNGLTPLHVASREGHLHCVERLLDLGPSPLCATQSAGLTPIHYASLFGHCGCLMAMLDRLQSLTDLAQVFFNEGNADSIQPIHLAAANGWLQCVKVLISYGSPSTPLASVMCITRVSPAHFMTPPPITHTSSDITKETEVMVQRIPSSTPEEVAAGSSWHDVVECLRVVRAGVSYLHVDFV